MTNNSSLDTKESALKAVEAANDKKALDILILEVANLLYITDYFIICSGATDRQTRIIAENIIVTLKHAGRKMLRIAGEDSGEWILLDFGDFVVHVFTEETREYYQLEKLWSDAPRIEFN